MQFCVEIRRQISTEITCFQDLLCYWHNRPLLGLCSALDFGRVHDISIEFEFVHSQIKFEMNKYSQTPWPLVRKRTIPTEGPPLVNEI
jgi:hypothetical protein